MIRYMQSLYPSTFDLIFKEALNKRIGIKEQKDFHQTFEDLLVASVIEKSMTLEQLFTEPELDSWIYSTPDDGPHAFSSSTYVAWVYKAAGIFDGLEINA